VIELIKMHTRIWAFLLCERNDRLMTWSCVSCSSVPWLWILIVGISCFFYSNSVPWVVSLLLSLIFPYSRIASLTSKIYRSLTCDMYASYSWFYTSLFICIHCVPHPLHFDIWLSYSNCSVNIWTEGNVYEDNIYKK
jgi:hypothetical protein